ncbi:MAG: prepilin-type N-terminal cleavage/methylation domain-containing protein [Phycisphaerae bacterium]|nr:prepilin-type N-terminal cleavage/methylation domain-containing protein [Phycisphaerae bacterium]
MRRGFTLIELLVVVAIIALLISILLPSLNGARRSARQTLCLTNERNIGVAVRQYAEENGDVHHVQWANDALRFVSVSGGRFQLLRPFLLLPNGQVNTQARVAYWAALYDPYFGVFTDPAFYGIQGFGPQSMLKGWENTRCPEAKYTLPAFRQIAGTGSESGGGSATFPDDPYTSYSSYCFNGVTGGFSGVVDVGYPNLFRNQNGVRVPQKLGRINRPSDIIMFHDGSEVMLDGNGDTLFQMDQWTTTVLGVEKSRWIEEYFRHPGGSAVGWVDGHANMTSRNRAAEVKREWRAERPSLGIGGVPLTQRIPYYNAPF